MAKGISINIGINTVNPKHYGSWDDQLSGCENDAEDMAGIAKDNGFEVTKLLTKDATVDNLKKNLTSAAENLKSGDFFLLTYSGHGGTLPDENNDEDDFKDKTWCLYDRQFVDDELYYYLSKFKEGVRILVLVDSCTSGVVRKAAMSPGSSNYSIDQYNSNISNKGIKYRFVPDYILGRTYQINRKNYDQILSDKKIIEEGKKIKAAVILISSCQKYQFAADGTFNGLFTANLLKVWNKGSFTGSYPNFHKKIVHKMLISDQIPELVRIGKIDDSFLKQKPFAI